MTAGACPSFRARRAWFTLAITVVLSLIVDLGTKVVAFERVAGMPVVLERDQVLAADRPNLLIPRHDPVVVAPKVLEFKLVLNEGAVFGIGAGKRWFFVAFTVVAVGFVLWLFGTGTRSKDWVGHVAAGLLIGGGIGNLYDRIRFACVRDFLHPLPGVEVGGREVWPYVSNVADLFVIVGIIVLLIRTWRTPGDEGSAPVSGRADA